jgi:hypothetical protein
MGQYTHEVVVACFIVFIRDGQQQNFLPEYLMSGGNKQNNWVPCYQAHNEDLPRSFGLLELITF